MTEPLETPIRRSLDLSKRSTTVTCRPKSSSPRLGLAFLIALAACGPEPRRVGPNIVLIVVDTLRADMVLVEGHRANTPGLDRLSEDGVVFTSAFSHAPMTLPSHTSLFASRAPFETGVYNNGRPVPTDLPLVAEWLANHGYSTHAVTSLGTLVPFRMTGVDRGFHTFDDEYWHMDSAPRTLDRIRRTLDEIDPRRSFFLFAHFSDPHAPYNSHDEPSASASVTLDGDELGEFSLSELAQWDRTFELPPGRHVVDFRAERAFVVKALEWKGNGEYLTTKWEIGAEAESGSHARVSVDVTEQISSRLRFWIAAPTNRADIPERYVGEVEFADRSVGELIDELRSRGLYDESIIVFTSDHGEALGDGGLVGHVQSLDDELLHVPLVIKLPAGHPERERLVLARDSLVPHQDVVPTLLQLAAIDPLPGQRGRSLFEGGSTLLIAETHKPEARRNLVCFRDEKFKLIFDPDIDEFQLYDLDADPNEEVNVFATRKSERAEWIESLRAIATSAAEREDGATALDPDAERNLRALGYGGG